MMITICCYCFDHWVTNTLNHSRYYSDTCQAEHVWKPSYIICWVTQVASYPSTKHLDHAKWNTCWAYSWCQADQVPSASISICRAYCVLPSYLEWHKQICKPFLSQHMEHSRDKEDTDEHISIPYVASMQPIRKMERVKGKYSLSGNRWWNLSHRFLSNLESLKSI